MRDASAWKAMSKPSTFYDGCKFRKGKYSRFCQASNSQCGSCNQHPACMRTFAVRTLYCWRKRALMVKMPLFTAQFPLVDWSTNYCKYHSKGFIARLAQ